MFMKNCTVNKVSLSPTKDGSIVAELKILTSIEPEEVGKLEEVLNGRVDVGVNRVQLELFKGEGDSVQGGDGGEQNADEEIPD